MHVGYVSESRFSAGRNGLTDFYGFFSILNKELWNFKKMLLIYFFVGIKNFEILAFLHAASCMVMIDFKLAGLKLLESSKA